MTLREQVIHGLRMQGWSRIEAENEADARTASGIEARQRTDPEEGLDPKGESPTAEAGDAQ